jgi:plastocyanin
MVLLAAAAALAAPAVADTPTLQGHVGPMYTISVSTSTGDSVTHLDPGTYGLHVIDEADIHDFHLSGPGVDVVLGQVGQGVFDKQVTFVTGTYRFFCDFHPAVMKGFFTVGTPATVQQLAATVTAAGRLTFSRSATAGKAVITVRDLSAKDNFHLSGPGVNKKTGLAFKGTVKWTVTLQSGTYTYRSDAHPTKKHTLTVA